jgi:hypothetical protein
MTLPQQQTQYDFDLVWREQQHEFIVGFGEGEHRRCKDVTPVSMTNYESDDIDERRVSRAIIYGDAGEESSVFHILDSACESSKQQLVPVSKIAKDGNSYHPVTPDALKLRGNAIPVVTPPSGMSSSLSCGSEATTPKSNRSTPNRNTVRSDVQIRPIEPSENLVTGFPFDNDRPRSRDHHSINSSLGIGSRRLPEEYGPIRREMPYSSAVSEATTDLASNTYFPRLASTILSSQALKKPVEPLDRIAELLEAKGVGRGTSGPRKIRESSSLRLLIDEYSEANFWPLLDSLYFNLNLKKLVLFRRRQSDQGRIRTQQEMDCLFRVLNRPLSSLSELHLWSFSPDDQGVLSRGLGNYVALEYVQLHLETGSMSEKLAEALTSLPNLVSLEVEVSESFPLSILLDSPSLGVLSVICPPQSRFYFPDEEIFRFAKKLEGNTNLFMLSLEPLISATHALPAIMGALSRGNQTLETFQFSATVSSTEHGDFAMQKILDCLNDTSLRVLWNNLDESWNVSSEMKQNLLNVLKSNTTMEQFHVFSELHRLFE